MQSAGPAHTNALPATVSEPLARFGDTTSTDSESPVRTAVAASQVGRAGDYSPKNLRVLVALRPLASKLDSVWPWLRLMPT